jgi:hypothetical protein
MKINKKIKISLIVILSLITFLALGRLAQKTLDNFYTGVRTPYLQMPSPTGLTLRWQSLENYQGTVSITQNEATTAFSESNLSEEHELRLQQLKPLTQYFYSAGKKDSPKYQGENYWFVTPPKTGSTVPVRFWVTGDQGKLGKIQRKVKKSAVKWLKNNLRPNRAYLDFWLTTGDNAYSSGSNQQFQDTFFEPYKNILKNIPVWPAYGNHDARRWAFFDIFTFPENAESGGIASGTENYYSFDYGNIHFVFLDSQSSDLDSDADMAKWLVDDLNANKQTWLIAVFHHPPYTKGSHNSDNNSDSRGRLKAVREEILPILEHFDTDLVLTGHSHVYERSHFMTCHYGKSDTIKDSMILDTDRFFEKPTKHAPNQGTVYTVVGSSSKVNDGSLDHPAMDVAKSKAGSLIIDVEGNKLISRFISKKGKVTDKFSIVKRVDMKTAKTAPCL